VANSFRIQEVTFDCADAARLAEFWGTLLNRPWGYRPEPGGVVDGGDMWLLFQIVPEPKSSPKNRLHLDIEVDDIHQAATRAEGLGATRVSEFHDDPGGGGFVVMHDPEANEFCLVAQPEGSWTRLLNAIAAERDGHNCHGA
jgi:catechol 2,3-dioxygenase-like lactoylglutathione lyase family enzyme